MNERVGGEPLTITPGYALYNTPDARARWLIDGLVPVGATFCVNGRGSTYKSWSITAAGIAVATTTKFMGHFSCTNQGVRNSVLFVELEESRAQTARKYRKLLRGMFATAQEVQDLLCAFVVGQPARIDDDAKLDAIKHAIDQTAPDLVLWDNARRMMRGDMNSDEWPAALAERINDMKGIFPSAHGLVHHWRKRSADKGMNDPDQMGRGSEGLRDICDVWLPVELDIGGLLTMHQTKNRDGELLRPFSYSVRIADSEEMATLQYNGTAALDKDGPSAADAILEELTLKPEIPITTKDMCERLSDRFTDRQVRIGRDSLRARQLIAVEKSGGRTSNRIALIRYAAMLFEPDQPPNPTQPDVGHVGLRKDLE